MVGLILGVLCLWLVFIVAGRREALIANRWNAGLVVLGFTVLAVVTVATSDNTVIDREVYLRQFEILADTDRPWDSPYFEGDALFVVFLWALARIVPTTEVVLYAVVAAVIATGCLLAFRRLLPAWAVLGAWVTLLATGLFAAYSGVAVRQGLAMACLLVAVSMIASGEYQRRWLLMLLAAAGLLHWTAVPLALGLLVLTRWTPGVRTLVTGWSVLALGFALGLNRTLLGGLQLEGLDKYSSRDAYASYGTDAVRLDFLAASALFLLVALVGVRYLGQDDPVQRRLLAAYVLFNSIFLLLGFVAFSDRLAAYSWFLVPLLVWYPLSARDSRNSVALSAGLTVAMLGVGLTYGPIVSLAGA